MSTTPKKSMRLFYALWPEDATRAGLLEIQASLQGRLTRYENLHMTLAFLGQQPVDSLPVLTDILTHLPQFDINLTLDRVGYFTRSRIAWTGTHQVPESLHALQQHLVQALTAQGIAFDNHGTFKPHVTLARDAPNPPDIPFTPIRWHAHHVALVESITQPEGPVYNVLASRNLTEKVWIPDEDRIGN